MRCFVFIVAGLIVLSAVNAAAGPFNVGKALIYDIPETTLKTISEKLPGSELTPDELKDMTTYRFVGDSVRALVVLVNWFDRPQTYPASVFNSTVFSRNVWATGSVADYFGEVSCGQVKITGDVYGWHDAGSYQSFDEIYGFLNLVTALDGVIDYSQYDGDGDGRVDAMIFIYAGNGEEDSGIAADIWSFALSMSDAYAPVCDGVKITRFCTAAETMPLRNALMPRQFSGVDTLNTVSVACHELTHVLGLPDLYDYDSKLDTITYKTPNDDNDHPVVDWCLMGYNGYGLLAIKKIIPPHLIGWCKKEMGWNEPVDLKASLYEDLIMYDIETHSTNSLYRVPISEDGNEYFLLEYRNPGASGKFDKTDSDFSVYFWPNLTFGNDTLDRGLIITHVDEVAAEGDHYINYGTPTYDHYTVAVEDAGYNPSRDMYSNPEGHVTDSAQWWYPYETRRAAAWSDETDGQQTFGPYSVPNSNGYNDVFTGITIRVDSIVDDRLYANVMVDRDGDGIHDDIDICPDEANPGGEDADLDGIGAPCDNCPDVYNPGQEDANLNGVGDACEFVCGDANNDSLVNLLDILYLIDHIYGNPPGAEPVPFEAGDVNFDGVLNLLDILLLIENIYGSGTALNCG